MEMLKYFCHIREVKYLNFHLDWKKPILLLSSCSFYSMAINEIHALTHVQSDNTR